MIFETNEFLVARVAAQDIAGILEVYNSNPEFLIKHVGKSAVAPDWLTEELELMNQKGFCSGKIVEKASGKIIGIVDFKIEEATYLSLLMLHGSCQGKGRGRSIYDAFEAYASQEGSRRIRIDVVTGYSDTVLEFWQRCGFTEKEAVTLHWAEMLLPAVVMVKKIKLP